jgi:hypothetical protein
MFYRGEHYQSEGPVAEPEPAPPQLKLVRDSDGGDGQQG